MNFKKIVQSNGWRWFVVVTWLLMALMQFRNHVHRHEPYSLAIGVGAFFFAGGFFLAWPLQQESERFSTISSRRKIGSVVAFIGGILVFGSTMLSLIAAR